MNQYADIKVKNLSLFSFRNYLNNDIVNLFFSSNDLIVSLGDEENLEELEEDDSSAKYMYKTTVQRVKERLDARGFGIDNFKKIFDNNMLQAIDYFPFFNHLKIEFTDCEIQERIINKITFKKWKNAMKKIVTYELEHGNISWYKKTSKIEINTECEKVIFYSLKEDYPESFYALSIEIVDIAYIFRLILENCVCNDEIVLDFTNLDYWAKDCIPKALSAADDVEKVIVLVEGTSDKDILEYSLEKIYPHLSDLFYFMDFDDANGGKRDGGTSYVIKNLKTFYFSKIKAKFIAIFDNDAEGYQSKCTLLNDIKNWPQNFRILLYPELDLFNAYPTLAPNGKIVMDNINKKACSIELYLPDAIIKNNGRFFPIEWESRKKIKTENGTEKFLYQGVISQKDDIKKKFHELRNSIEKCEENFVIEDWDRMKQLLDTIIFAFA